MNVETEPAQSTGYWDTEGCERFDLAVRLFREPRFLVISETLLK